MGLCAARTLIEEAGSYPQSPTGHNRIDADDAKPILSSTVEPRQLTAS